MISIRQGPTQATLEFIEIEGADGGHAPRAELLQWPKVVRVEGNSKHNFYAGFNSGPTGIFVASRRAARIDEPAIIRFTVPNRIEVIVARCRTQWVREHGALTLALFAGIGFQFCDIAEDALRSVREFILTREPVFWE